MSGNLRVLVMTPERADELFRDGKRLDWLGPKMREMIDLMMERAAEREKKEREVAAV
jgi:hypothetical protein